MKETKQRIAGEKLNNGKLGINKAMMLDATLQSLVKLNPKVQVKNPVMFIVYRRYYNHYTLAAVLLVECRGRHMVYIRNIHYTLADIIIRQFCRSYCRRKGQAQAESLKKRAETLLHAN